jgi:predicted Zn finger-like uncharacterized protein
MFKVVADQLKISEGWVRCGHCADVFDATLYLQPWIPPGEEASAPDEVVAQRPEPERAPEPVSAQPFDAELEAELAAELQARPQGDSSWPTETAESPAELDWAAAEAVADERGVDTLPPPFVDAPKAEARSDEPESDFHAELERFAASLGRLKAEASTTTDSGDVVEAVAPDEDAVPEAPRPQDAGGLDVPLSDLGAPEPVPGFVRQAQRQAFWASRGVRAALSLLILMLAVLLSGQWALRERDRLAAWRPDLQPLLQRVCEPLGCTVAPVRRIDAIVIDSTSLVRRIGNFYSFDLVLKNTASMALAVPALELSLTDIGDEVIARRVLLPEEWPDAPALLPAHGSVNVSFRLSLVLGDATPMAGYRALVFYP